MGPLGESEGPSIGKGRECEVESRHLQDFSPPPVSIKDRWVGPHEQELIVLITC
jgi:hypothetical protein